MSIFKIKTNHNISFSKSAEPFFKNISIYVNKKMKLMTLYNSLFYKLPKDDLNNNIIRSIGWCYKNDKGTFNNHLRLLYLPLYIFFYYGMLFYILCFSKFKFKKSEVDLLVCDINDDREIKRINKLLSKFHNKKIALFVRGSVDDYKNFTIVKQKNYKNYDFFLVIKTIFFELVFGLFINIVISLYYKHNTFYHQIRFINNYLEYASIFKNFKSKYLYIERYIKISPIMRSLYHMYGGKIFFTSQKSILASDQTSFCYNFDIMFSLGKKSMNKSKYFHGKIDKIIPVGSLFRNQFMLSKKFIDSEKSIDDKYDVVFFGGNIVEASFFRNYKNFLNDYYDSLEWLKSIAIKYPDFKIGIKHHNNAKVDLIEENIFKNTNIEIIDNLMDSYSLISNCRVSITYASTIGYEALSMGKPCIFLDPNEGNNFLPKISDNRITDIFRAKSLDEFMSQFDYLLSGSFHIDKYKNDIEEIIYQEKDIAEIMYKNLIH